jgi:hypothetical protein
MAVQRGGYLQRPAPSGLADVIEILLDKGIVIDAYVRVSVVGIELLTIDARVVVASADTYLRFAEATNRLELEEHGGRTLPDILETGLENVTREVAAKVVENKVEDGLESLERGAEKLGDAASAVVSGAQRVGRRLAAAVTPDDGSDGDS